MSSKIPRSEHNISRANISNNALTVLRKLNKSGYDAYLVGGGVRDLLLGREPKDFDIATNATPEEVKPLFRRALIIGKRFRIVHVRFGREIIEVSTFRSQEKPDDEHLSDDGMILRDNSFGSLEEDAWRRDFTINALYYTTKNFSVVDHTNGMADIKAGVLRLIGDPVSRYREDPVRMLRAVRFSTKLGFKIHPECEAPIFEMGSLLENISSARLYEEVLKMFHGGAALATFEALRHFNLFAYLFPQTEEVLNNLPGDLPQLLLINALKSTDQRISEGKPVTPSFLIAALLYKPMRQLQQKHLAAGESIVPATIAAARSVQSKQQKSVSTPKRFNLAARDIWMLQNRFQQRRGKRPFKLLSHPKFRAAYDFLILRAESGEDVAELAQWWTRFQEVSNKERSKMVSS